jgi:hypothetical protein
MLPLHAVQTEIQSLWIGDVRHKVKLTNGSPIAVMVHDPFDVWVDVEDAELE